MRTKRIPKRITWRMLWQMGACPGGCSAFHDLFGESAAFVPANIYLASESPDARPHLWWLLELIDEAEAAVAYRRHHLEVQRSGRPAFCVPQWPFFAAALCRLARRNLPKRKGK